MIQKYKKFLPNIRLFYAAQRNQQHNVTKSTNFKRDVTQENASSKGDQYQPGVTDEEKRKIEEKMAEKKTVETKNGTIKSNFGIKEAPTEAKAGAKLPEDLRDVNEFNDFSADPSKKDLSKKHYAKSSGEYLDSAFNGPTEGQYPYVGKSNDHVDINSTGGARVGLGRQSNYASGAAGTHNEEAKKKGENPNANPNEESSKKS